MDPASKRAQIMLAFLRPMISEARPPVNLPTTIGPAPFYPLDEHPKSCPELDADDTCEVSFNVHAIGAVTDKAKFQAVASNNYSLDSSEPVKATITNPETTCDAANLDAVDPVNFHDFVILADQWLQTFPTLSADINVDQSVNMLDLAIIAEYWLSNCK